MAGLRPPLGAGWNLRSLPHDRLHQAGPRGAPACHRAWALRKADQDWGGEGAVVRDLISEVTAHDYGPVIFPRIQPLGPAHPLGEEAPQSRRTRRGFPEPVTEAVQHGDGEKPRRTGKQRTDPTILKADKKSRHRTEEGISCHKSPDRAHSVTSTLSAMVETATQGRQASAWTWPWTIRSIQSVCV